MNRLYALACASLFAIQASAISAQEVTIKSTQVAPNIHMLQGKGGNIGVD